LEYRNTGNLGDEIQSIAARRFLPRIDCMLDRDRLNARIAEPGRPVKLIMNGWYTHHPENWPPSPTLEPLLISLHLSDQMTSTGFSAAEALVVGDNASWLRRKGPVGARDLWTLNLLRINRIDAWFSGCLTLTLPPQPGTEARRLVIANDVSDSVAAMIATRAAGPVMRTTHVATPRSSSQTRFASASALLCHYRAARCVVTTRLHCALPCLAMGTPVLLITQPERSKRYDGFLDLLFHCSAAEFLHDRVRFDLRMPPANSTRFHSLRDQLIRVCTNFIASSHVNL
jgi:hypothetical protein